MNRSYRGYIQFRSSSSKQWQFQVEGFEAGQGRAERCRLLRTDGQTKAVPIDEHDRIIVAGRKFSAAHWTH